MEQEKMIELLEKLEKAERKNLIYQRISTVLLLVFVIAVVYLIPGIVSTLNTAKSTLTKMDGAIAKMETTLDSVGNLAKEGSTAMEGMEDALSKIQKIDIETLNQAITDLSEVVEPMSNVFGMFK